MPIIRATFFFKVGESGWTESFYSTKQTLATALADAIILGVKLRNLKAGNVDWFATRVSDDLVKGDSLLYPTDVGSHFNVTPGVGNINAAWDAAEIRLESGTLRRRIYIMRGIEDNAQQGGVYLPTATITAKYPTFQTEMEGGKWGLRVQDAVNVKRWIATIAPGPTPSIIAITTADPHLLVTGDMIYIGGPDRSGLFRGFHRVIVVNANTIWIQAAPITTFLTGMYYLRKVTYVVTAFDNCTQILRLGKRDTGRPSFGPRGRRSARRLR